MYSPKEEARRRLMIPRLLPEEHQNLLLGYLYNSTDYFQRHFMCNIGRWLNVDISDLPESPMQHVGEKTNLWDSTQEEIKLSLDALRYAMLTCAAASLRRPEHFRKYWKQSWDAIQTNCKHFVCLSRWHAPLYIALWLLVSMKYNKPVFWKQERLYLNDGPLHHEVPLSGSVMQIVQRDQIKEFHELNAINWCHFSRVGLVGFS